MSTPPKPVPDAAKILGVSATKRVLIVEGPSDKAIYTKWLEKLAHPNLFSVKVELLDGGGQGNGGGKSVVLKALEWFRDNGNPDRVFGLVDRDEWDASTVQQKLALLAQLRVHQERHALESYFCDPDEIIPRLVAHDASWTPATALLRAQVVGQLPNYVDHWALRATTDRLKNNLLEHGYPGHFADTIPIPANADIQKRFEQWEAVIDADATSKAFQQLQQTAAAVSASAKCRSHTWAKPFFHNVVLGGPNGIKTFHNKSALDCMIDLAEWGNVPGDIAAILQALLV